MEKVKISIEDDEIVVYDIIRSASQFNSFSSLIGMTIEDIEYDEYNDVILHLSRT